MTLVSTSYEEKKVERRREETRSGDNGMTEARGEGVVVSHLSRWFFESGNQSMDASFSLLPPHTTMEGCVDRRATCSSTSAATLAKNEAFV